MLNFYYEMMNDGLQHGKNGGRAENQVHKNASYFCCPAAVLSTRPVSQHIQKISLFRQHHSIIRELLATGGLKFL